MKIPVKTLLVRTLISVAMLGVMLEIALRVVPGLVPVPILSHFQEDMRAEVARAIGLPTGDDVEVLERGDGGPDLYLWRPHAVVTRPFDDPGTVDTVTMDRHGFSNPDAAWDVESVDLIAIGDSFTWATNVPVELTWPHLIARDTGITALNLGKDGTGTYSQLEILRQFGLKKKPGTVVLNIYQGNDLRDVLRHHKFIAGGGHAQKEETGSLYRTLRDGFLGRNSRAWNLALATPAWLWRHVINPTVHADNEAEKEINFRYKLDTPDGVVPFNTANADRDEVYYARQLMGDNEVSMELFREGLETFVDLGRAHGFTPVVSFSPSTWRAYGPRATFEDPQVGVDLAAASDHMVDWLVATCRELGCRFVDLTPALRAAASQPGEPLYFPSNVHYSRRGHGVVARAMAAGIPDLVPR